MILMKKTVIVEAPGKINLSFDITGKRADGYHNVDTIMQTIDLCDTVTISRMDQKGIFISCDRPRIPCDETNFAHNSASRIRAFQSISRSGCRFRRDLPAAAPMRPPC